MFIFNWIRLSTIDTALNIKLVEKCRVYNKGTGTSCKGQLANTIFQTGFVVAGGYFLSYWNYQLIKFEGEKRFGL